MEKEDLKELKTEDLLEQYYEVEYKIDELISKRDSFIKELRARDLDCMVANCQADLYF